MSRLRLTGFALLLISIVGCTGAASSPSPTPSPSQSPTPTPQPSPPNEGGLYLRAWETQALPPPSTFLSGPLVTVSEGIWIDNMVAVPAIFPGPLLILQNARTITPAGEQAIIDQARELGLLEGPTDFTGGGVAPGGVTANLLLIIGDTRHELIGDPGRAKFCADGKLCPVDPGTPEAFAAFWSVLQDTSWLEANLGPNNRYQPERLAVLVVAPATANGDIMPNKTEWPLDADFATFGAPFVGGEDLRCAVVSGDDLAALLPALLNANQMTVFVDSAGVEKSLNVRALVPGEDPPC